MLKMYALRDTVARVWFAPFVSANHGAALRSVVTAATMDSTIVGQHPEDFDLYYIGDWNEDTAGMSEAPHESLGNISAFISRMKERNVVA